MGWWKKIFKEKKGRLAAKMPCSTVADELESNSFSNSGDRSSGNRTSPVPTATSDERLAITDKRIIRVFISSTFRDMQKERELLVKEVFPELRRICNERFVSFTEVDLRWGISKEQDADGKVLPICLEEIHYCRPYFIGFLGERYGWIPESIPQEVIEQEPWLQAHVGGRTSITELEILHGVLNDPEMADYSFFYFRDPAYVNSIPENDRKDFLPENPESADKLRKLKKRIRESGLPVLANYASPWLSGSSGPQAIHGTH